MPALLGIWCVPPSISPPWCGVAAHAQTVTTKTTAPAQVIALFIARCRIRVDMYLPFQPLAALTENFRRNSTSACRETFYALAVPPGNDLNQAAIRARKCAS